MEAGRIIDFSTILIDRLTDPDEAEAFLTATSKEDDEPAMQLALCHVAEVAALRVACGP